MSNIRVARLQDNDAIKIIAKMSKHTHDFGNPPLYMRNELPQLYEQGQIIKAVLPRTRAIVGFAYFKHLTIKDYTSLYHMGVDKARRGQGCGRAMLQFIMKGSPHKCIQLVCDEDNADGLQFYTSCNFREVDRKQRANGKWIKILQWRYV